MASFLFTQQWRRNEACFDNLRAAVMAELAAETDKKRRETDRINSENNTKRTAAAAAVAPSEVAGVSEATKTQGDNGNASTAIANNSSSHGCSDDAEDGYGSQVLIPVSLPAAGHSSSSAALAPSRSSSSSSASSGSGGGGGAAGTVPRPPGTEGEPSTALRAVTEKVVGSGDDAEVPAGRDANASATADTTGKNHSNRRSTATSAAAAVAVAGRYAAPSATRRATTTKKVRRASVAGKTNVAAYRFLEDLIPAGPRSTGRAPPRRSKSRPLGDANGKEESKNKKQGRKVQAPAPASAVASGPFSELSLCVVHLGSVTSNTIKAFCRGVRDGGGGRVSTRYEPGCTTHIVADASLALSLEKLHRYFAGCGDDGDGFDTDFGDDHDAAAVVGVDEAAAAVGAGARGRTRTRTPDDDGVPFVSSEWVVECLRHSAVVATAPYLLTLPRRAAAAEQAPAEAAGLTRRHEGSGTSANVAGGGLTAADTTTAAAIAYKRKLDARDDGDDNGSRLSAVASAHPHGRRTQEQQEAELGDGGDAAAESIPKGMSEVQGGFGAREPDVGKRKHKFHCQFTSSRGDHLVFNEEAAKKLERLAELYAAQGGDGSVFRERGFKNAAGVLRRLGAHITDVEQLKDMRKNEPDRVRGLGDSVMKELASFYAEGRMNRLEGLEANPKTKSMELLQRISWVGEATAEKLWENGLRSIEDVRDRGQHLLTEQARICLKRHEDIVQRMPRSEAAEIEAMVTKVAQSICPGIICQACGSYRRGKSDCGDVDVLIRPPEGQEDSPIFFELIDKLASMDFVTDKLAMPEGSHTPGKSQTFMGICKLPGPGRLHRRLDIKLYPTSMFAFAVLYFTGSGRFNISMRSFAKMKGLKLSDKGLCKVNSVNGEEVHRFPSYSCLREEDVFAALGLEWRKPKDRDGVQVEPFYSLEAGGAVELSGRVAPVPPPELEQKRWPALVHQQEGMLQQGGFPVMMAEAGYHQSNENATQLQQLQQQQQQEQIMRQQAASFFEKQNKQEEDELRRAILLSSRCAFGTGGGLTGSQGSAAAAAAAAAGAGEGAGAGAHTLGNKATLEQDEDQMFQEAIRRSVADTTAAGETRGEHCGELDRGGAAAGGDEAGVGDGGDAGVGAGSEDSPVCL